MLDDVVLVLQNITHYVMMKMATNSCEHPTVLAPTHGECVRNFELSRNFNPKIGISFRNVLLKGQTKYVGGPAGPFKYFLYKVFKDLL